MIHWSSYELNKFCILTTAESMAVKSIYETALVRRLVYAMSKSVFSGEKKSDFLATGHISVTSRETFAKG